MAHRRAGPRGRRSPSTRSATTPARACSTPPERSGRHKLYGPDHLERLGRIRELQAQRFSLAAIRAILDVDRPGLEGLFAAAGPQLHARRADREVRPRRRARRPAARRSGCSPTRSRSGTTSTTTPTSACSARSSSCATIGMTEDILVELGAIYVATSARSRPTCSTMLAGTRPRRGIPTSSSRCSAADRELDSA